MSHTFSDRAPHPKSYVGISLVVAIHLAAIYALSTGLMKTPPRPHEATILLPPIKEKPPEQQPVETKKAEQPTLISVKPEVPPLPTWKEETPTLVVTEQRPGETVVSAGSSTGTGTTVQPPPLVKPEPAIKAAGAVCSVMPKPDVPAVNWAGEAVLQVIATVRGGRVVGTDFRVAQGALDAKTRRSLQRSVESALAGYRCQGDAMFQQDFAFRLD